MLRNSVLFDSNTNMNHYQVVETIYNGRPARVLYSGNRMAAQSGLPLDDNPALLFDYNERFMELMRGLQPRSLLVLGGGALTLPTAARNAFPRLAIEVVELDAGLVDIAQRFFDFVPDPQLVVHVEDGHLFIKTTRNQYDMIILDVFQNTTIPDSFQTIEAARDLKRCLNKGGLLAVNVIGSLQGDRSDVIRRLYAVLSQEFLQVDIFPAEHGLSAWASQNFVITAQEKPKDPSAYLRYPPVSLPKS